MSFIYSSCLIALARTSNNMLNKSDKSGYPCLVPDLREKAFSFSPLSMMLALGLSYMGFIMLRYISFILFGFVEKFYHKWRFNFVRWFFYIYWDDYILFILDFVNMVCHIDWFLGVEPSSHPWNKIPLHHDVRSS